MTRRHAGLDWLSFFVAAVQTGFGAFVAIFLADRGWSQAAIGAATTAQTLAQFASQVPSGMLVDAARRTRQLLAVVITILGAGALLLAAWPQPLPAVLALMLVASAGSALYPALIALTRAVVGPRGFGERIGRNARWAAIGSAAGAAAMGLTARIFTERGVLVLAALLCIPALLALAATRPRLHRRPGPPPPGDHPPEPREIATPLLHDKRMQVFLLCAFLFNLASAALLVVASPNVNQRAGDNAGLLIAAYIIVPQIIVALLAPLAGRIAEAIGRRPVLLLGFATLPLRAASFALIGNPYALVPVQVLEGAASAAYGVLVPLIIADITRNTGRTSLGLGLVGLAGTLGAALSTALAGTIATTLSPQAAYITLTIFGLLALATCALALPETRR
jgi:MFS family permease